MRLLKNLIDRSLPALLIASSVTFLTAGLLSYSPSAFSDWRTPEPEIGGGDPLLKPSASPTGQPSSTPVELTSPTPSQPSSTPVELTSPTPSQPPTETLIPAAGIPSRIRIPSLDIDLPIVPSDIDVSGNQALYPLCDVAMFLREFVLPGQQGTTYIYGHAQRGMFAPVAQGLADR